MNHDYEVEIVKDAYGYLVECYECGKEFEAVRSDSAFCSSTCRSRNHRNKKKLDKDIQKTKALIDDLIKRMPSRGQSKTFVALSEMNLKINRALSTVEGE